MWRADNWDSGSWAWKNLRTAERPRTDGTTTSGCVRATAVDAFSNNYRVSLVEEACFDRSQASHAMSLCDLHAKYADVVKLDAAVAFIQSLPTGMFDLPHGVDAHP